MRHRGDWLVIAQFVLLAVLLVVPGPPLWSAPWVTAAAVMLVAVGGTLAVAGAVVLGRDLVPWVAPREGAALHVGGVFRFTRNPIYLGILVASAGWVLWRARVELLIVWGVLTVVLIAKARVEQRYLSAAFGDQYTDYAERTPLIFFRRGVR